MLNKYLCLSVRDSVRNVCVLSLIDLFGMQTYHCDLESRHGHFSSYHSIITIALGVSCFQMIVQYRENHRELLRIL